MTDAHAGTALAPPINADRRLRGPYTAGGAIVGAVLPVAARSWPELVAAHDIALRTVAPDLADLVPARRLTLADGLAPDERILVPAPQRTLRIANSLADFVTGHLTRLGAGPYALAVHNIGRADAADRELLEVLRRRVDPALLTLITAPEGPDEVGEPADPSLIGARLGAVPYLLDQGPDARQAAAAAAFAAQWCLWNGCHHSAAELGRRGLRKARLEDDPEIWWGLVHDTAMALVALGREDEAEHVLKQARAATISPVWLSTIAYTQAMIKTRHHDPAERDLAAALGWINTAIALCENLPDPRSRAVKLGFDLNGKALIESRRGNLDEALALVRAAIDLADRELPSGAQPVHRLVLRANRAQLLVRSGALETALADLDAVIAADPGYPDYYVDRGNLLHQLGREEEAVADYEKALEVGLPFPEPYFNRAEIHYARGDHASARADLDRALDLDPDFLDARVNRAGLLVELAEYEPARDDVEAGLLLDPANAYLRCTLGQIELAEGRHELAARAFDAAVSLAPDMAVAWANRAMLAFESGDADTAIDDLSAALLIEEDPALLYNRAMAFRSAGKEAQARADLTRARELDPDDPDIRRALAG